MPIALFPECPKVMQQLLVNAALAYLVAKTADFTSRALTKDPAILILDDTTSAVDMETESKFKRTRSFDGRKRHLLLPTEFLL